MQSIVIGRKFVKEDRSAIEDTKEQKDGEKVYINNKDNN